MPKVIAKPLSLTVRPLKVSHLCFEVGGILGRSFAELGMKVAAFDFDNLYKAFRDANKGEAIDPGRLSFDSDGIDAQTITTPIPGGRPFALATLRAETVKAALNKAIRARENAFITKYGGVAAIADVMRKIIPPRGRQINRLSALSDGQMKVLNEAYEKDPDRSGVVTTTINTSDSTLKNDGTSTTKAPPGADSTQVSNNHAAEHQTIVTKNTEFRAPTFENLARNERAQISLGEEVISFVRETHYLDRLEEVFENELASIDADVNQMQVAYLNTILMSPTDGIVTGVYKNPGDSVRAGEPVFRVENNADVLIVATVVCRGPIVVGSILQVKTTLFDLPGSPVTIEAEVVAARGQGEDDQWEVIAKRSNLDETGKIIFPLGYHFDYDDTEVAIFGPGEI
jgi:hypothetical protein